MKTIRTFIIAVLFLITLRCTAQDSVVVIKPSTAEYFLEADDERYLLRDKVIVLENDNKNLETKVFNLQGVITTHMIEEIKNTEEYNLVIDELNTCYGDQDEAVAVIEHLEKKNRFLKTLLKIGAGAIVVLAIL